MSIKDNMKGFERLPDFAGFQVWRSIAPVDKIQMHYIAVCDPYELKRQIEAKNVQKLKGNSQQGYYCNI